LDQRSSKIKTTWKKHLMKIQKIKKKHMVCATIVSILVVVIPTSNDWVTTIPIGCLRVSTFVASDMIGEVVLI